ncbi:MAG: cell division protein FtsQ/DivIB [Aquabacterium sp.]
MASRRPAGARTAATPLPADVRWMNASAALLAAAAVLALAGAGLARAARHPALDLKAIRLEGDLQRNSAAQVRANVAHRLSGNFVTMDLQQAKAAFEALPWVRRAVVSRAWPGRILVRLEEHRPVAVWVGEDGNDRLVNSFGEVFDANLGDIEDDGLPLLAGPADRAAAMLGMQQRLARTLQAVGGPVERLDLTVRGSWRATLEGGTQIELGRGSDAEVLARAERLARTVAQVTGHFGRPLQYADLRHADGYAVRLAGVVTVAPAGVVTVAPAGTPGGRKP